MVETNRESTTYLSKVWRALTKSLEIWKTLYLGIVVQVLQQIEGLKTIPYDLPKVLKRFNFLFSLFFTYLIHLLDLIGTILELLLVDRLGKNVLIKTSFF